MDISRLVEEHGPRVWALCRRLDPQPEDAYQELWAKLLTAEFDPAGPATFRTWLTTVTHRHLVDRHRRRLTRQRRHVDEDVHDEAFAASEPAPDTSMCQSATPAQLEAALAALPEAHRRIKDDGIDQDCDGEDSVTEVDDTAEDTGVPADSGDSGDSGDSAADSADPADSAAEIGEAGETGGTKPEGCDGPATSGGCAGGLGVGA